MAGRMVLFWLVFIIVEVILEGNIIIMLKDLYVFTEKEIHFRENYSCFKLSLIIFLIIDYCNVKPVDGNILLYDNFSTFFYPKKVFEDKTSPF